MFLNLEVEVYEEDKTTYVYLSHDGSSGCKYKYTTTEELQQIISDYVADTVRAINNKGETL